MDLLRHGTTTLKSEVHFLLVIKAVRNCSDVSAVSIVGTEADVKELKPICPISALDLKLCQGDPEMNYKWTKHTIPLHSVEQEYCPNVHVCLSSSGAALATARKVANRTTKALNCIVTAGCLLDFDENCEGRLV